MKNLKCSLPMKITAVLLSYLMMLILVLSTVSIAFMGYFDFYFNSPKDLQENILGDMLQGDCQSLAIYHDLDRPINYYYKASNLFYAIETVDGKDIESNYKGEKIITSQQYYNEDYIYTVYLADEVVTGECAAILYVADNLRRVATKLQRALLQIVVYLGCGNLALYRYLRESIIERYRGRGVDNGIGGICRTLTGCRGYSPRRRDKDYLGILSLHGITEVVAAIVVAATANRKVEPKSEKVVNIHNNRIMRQNYENYWKITIPILYLSQ